MVRIISFSLLFIYAGFVFGQEQMDGHRSDPESLVRKLYTELTFPKGETPDWNFVRSMFLEEALIFMRTGKETSKVFSLVEWVQDFEHFIDQANIIETGFEEKILKLKQESIGNIANVWVLYKAQIPGRDRSNIGLDAFQLIHLDGRWRILSILNEIPSPERPLPDIFQN